MGRLAQQAAQPTPRGQFNLAVAILSTATAEIATAVASLAGGRTSETVSQLQNTLEKLKSVADVLNMTPDQAAAEIVRRREQANG